MNEREKQRLMDLVLRVMEMDLEEFLVEMFADGSEFTNQWATWTLPKFNEEGKRLWEESNKCIEDRIAISIMTNEVIVEIEDGSERSISISNVYEAMAIMLNEYEDYYNQFLDGEFDGYTADVFLQCMVLGEVVYG